MRRIAFKGRELGTVRPHRLGRDEQARVVDRLQRELDPPRECGSGPLRTADLTSGKVLGVYGSFAGLLARRNYPEAGAQRVRLRVLRVVPFVKGLREPGETVSVGFDRAVR